MNPHPLYPLPDHTDATHAVWSPIIQGHTPPSPAQSTFIASVQRALDQGLTYNRDVETFVAREMALWFTPEMLSRNNTTGSRVHGGLFAFEVGAARDVIHARHERTLQQLARERLNLQVGQNFGVFYLSGKRTTGCTVLALDGDHVSMQGKRGTLAAPFSTTPHGIERLQADAQSRKARQTESGAAASRRSPHRGS